MRTTELKIGKDKKESVLVAGGKGFKVYSTSGFNGWILVIDRKVHIIEEDGPDIKTVAKYVNLRYQPISEQNLIIENFNDLVEAKSSTINQ